MQAAAVVILLSLCASLALPVPVDKSDQRRDGREISVEELESQLEDIENRISAVRTKVKQEAEENKEKLVTTKGTPPTSPTEKLIVRTTQAEEHTTVGNVKTTEKVQIIVEKETSPSPKTTPTPTPTEKATSTKISQTTTSVEKTPVVDKVEVVQEEQEKPEKAFVVKKVTEEVEEKEETAEEPEKIEDTKVANDETDLDEEADLESGRKEKSEKPTERVNTGKAAITTPVKTAETEFKVEKITPSPKSPTTSEQSEVKVEHVPPKLTVETKRSRVEWKEEDEDLQEGIGESKSSDGERRVEIKVEKESSKEPSPAESGQRKVIVEVEKISPSTDETDAETEEVEGTERTTAKPTATREVPTSKRLVDEVSISVEKITPSKRPTSGKPQSSVVNVVKETSEDEDLETRSENEVNSKRSDVAPAKTRDSDEEAALELELEGGQDKDNMENQKDKIDEEKLAQEFDKALKAERNGKEKLKTVEPVKPTSSADGPKTTKPQQVTTGEVKQTTESKGDETAKKLDSLEKQNDEAALEKEEAKKDISDEELELAELAQDKMNDDDKEETKPTIKSTTATPKDVVIKVEKVPKVRVQVTKVNDKRMLSEKETAKEEKKMKDELASELQQEKEGSPPVIMKVEKLGGSPDAKPAAEKAQDDPEERPDNKETAANKEEEEQESELEGELDTKTKRAASVTRNDLEEQRENLLAM